MSKLNFFELFKNALDEKNVTIKELEDFGVLKTNTFYNFSTYCPSLFNAIQIANHLQLSLDYILEKSDINNFKRYKNDQSNFYFKLKDMLKTYNISNHKFLKELNMDKNNFAKWKNGATPKFSTVIAISDYLGCGVDDLLEHE